FTTTETRRCCLLVLISLSASSSSSLFFFQCYRPLRDLHSFPTRRSSDLSMLESWRPGSLYVAYDVMKAGQTKIESITTSFGEIRSEEHTSELQSRFDLVCRLLLEKKKQISRHAARFLDP